MTLSLDARSPPSVIAGVIQRLSVSQLKRHKLCPRAWFFQKVMRLPEPTTGDDFAGGLVVRAFELFITTEARTCWVLGRCVLVTAHPDTPGDLPTGANLQSIAPTIAALGLPFVTVDLVLRADGVWHFVVLGDGQVSNRPTSTSPETFIAAIAGALGA